MSALLPNTCALIQPYKYFNGNSSSKIDFPTQNIYKGKSLQEDFLFEGCLGLSITKPEGNTLFPSILKQSIDDEHRNFYDYIISFTNFQAAIPLDGKRPVLYTELGNMYGIRVCRNIISLGRIPIQGRSNQDTWKDPKNYLVSNEPIAEVLKQILCDIEDFFESNMPQATIYQEY